MDYIAPYVRYGHIGIPSKSLTQRRSQVRVLFRPYFFTCGGVIICSPLLGAVDNTPLVRSARQYFGQLFLARSRVDGRTHPA